jgi:hypothetical protein
MMMIIIIIFLEKPKRRNRKGGRTEPLINASESVFQDFSTIAQVLTRPTDFTTSTALCFEENKRRDMFPFINPRTDILSMEEEAKQFSRKMCKVTQS